MKLVKLDRENKLSDNVAMNKLNDKQLENVVGGCSYESFELFDALRGNSAFQKDYPSLFAPPVNQEINIDDAAMAKALLEKLGIKAKINWGADTWFDCNSYVSADTGKTLYHRDVIKAIENYKG